MSTTNLITKKVKITEDIKLYIDKSVKKTTENKKASIELIEKPLNQSNKIFLTKSNHLSKPLICWTRY